MAFRRRIKNHAKRQRTGAGYVATAGLAAAGIAYNALRNRINRKRKSNFAHQEGVKKRIQQNVRTRTAAVPRRRNGRRFPRQGGLVTSEYSSVRARYGRRISKRAQLLKTVAGNTTFEVDRFGAINNYLNIVDAPVNQLNAEVGCGAYWLHNYYKSVGSQQYVPCHIFDLTGKYNLVDNVPTAPVVAYNMSFTESSSTTDQAWNPMVGRYGITLPTTTSTSWFLENNATGTAKYALDKAYLQNVTVRMMCYGAAQFPTQYSIDLVQFQEDWLTPGETSSGIHQKERIAMMEALIKNYLAHPIAKEYRGTKPKMKILKSIRFVLQPKLTIEAVGTGAGTTYNTIGHHKQVTFTMPINRLISYNWEKQGVGANMQAPDTSFQQIAQYKEVALPRSRIFLMVRATNTVQSSNVTPTCVNTPSYDLMIRRNWRDLN